MITKNELKNIKTLNQKKFRDEENKFLIEGTHLIQEALKENIKPEIVLVTQDFIEKNRDIIFQLNKNRLRTEIISPKEIESVSDAVTSQGIVGVVPKHSSNLPDLLGKTKKRKDYTIIALDEISDPGNMGTILRTADWFGVDTVLLSERCVDIYNPKAVRASMGSLFHLDILESIVFEKEIIKIKDYGFTIYATALNAVNFREMKYADKSLFLFGNESRGLREDLQKISDVSISIPQKGKAESLNVAIAAGIILSVKI